MTIKQYSIEDQMEAYNRMANNHSELMAMLTWSELFSIEVMCFVVDNANKILFESDDLYKGEVKKYHRNFLSLYYPYTREIGDKCYNNDRQAVRDSVYDIYMDLMKIVYPMENFINRYKVKNSFVLANVLLAHEIIDSAVYIHNSNIEIMRQYEKILSYSNFLSPETLVNPMNKLTLSISKACEVKDTIDLNDSMDIVNGIKVIINKVTDPDMIGKILNRVYSINGKRIKK